MSATETTAAIPADPTARTDPLDPRELREPFAVLRLMPQHVHILAAVVAITDVASWELIRSSCACEAPPREGAQEWRNLGTTKFDDLDAIRQAVRYLEARGLIERHPKHRHWVSVKARPDNPAQEAHT